MIKALMFDVDGVVNDYSSGGYVEYLVSCAEVRGRSFGDRELGEIRLRLVSAEKDYLEGRSDVGTFEKRIADEYGIGIDEVQWVARYKDTKANPEVVGLIGSLREKGYPVAFITNATAEGAVITRKFAKYADVFVAACDVGIAKPERGIFDIAMGRIAGKFGIDLSYGDVVFIDDSRVNVEGARRIGIDSILFSGADMLIEELRSRGVGVRERKKA